MIAGVTDLMLVTVDLQFIDPANGDQTAINVDNTTKRSAAMDEYPLLNLFWTMLMFMFIFIWIWVVVAVFTDNFRRNDHGGWSKALWTLFIVFLPILGVLAYIIARPKLTEQDQQLIASFQERQRRAEGYSSADEIAKAKSLLDAGTIDQNEYEKLKHRALA